MTHNALHSKTPTVTVLDNRGLTIREIAYHRHPDMQGVTDERITHHQNDARGVLALSADPRLHDAGLANFIYQADLIGAVLRTQSADAGISVVLNDAAGRPFLVVDNIGTDKNGAEDHSQAVTRTFQYEDSTLPGRLLGITEQATGEAGRVTERFVYAGNTEEGKARNLVGQCVSHYDTAGLVQTDSIALSGVPLSVTRRLLKEADNTNTVADWQGNDTSDWSTLLDTEAHITLTTADSTGSVLTTTDAVGNLQRMAYDVAGLLKGSWLMVKSGQEQVIIKSLTYSAAGQKLHEEHGNGVLTTYTYEPETQRLTGIKTERPSGHAAGARIMQDLRYKYDPMGNVLNVRNDAEETRFWRNQKVVPENTYVYDSLYQLVSATGREMANIGQQGSNLPAVTVPTDNTAYTNYTRTYTYDTAGNLTQIRHSAPASGNSYTTQITVSDRSNRAVLNLLAEDTTKVDALFDAGGHQSQLLPGQSLAWTPRGELLRVTPVERDGQPGDRETYRYDAGSQRVQKVSIQQTNNSTVNKRALYLPGLELRTTTIGETEKERLQVITVGAAGRAQVRVLHWENGKPADIDNNQLRYNYSTLTDSGDLEVDGNGNLISQEEYYPYGGTAGWMARNVVEAAYKTVRHSGKERDTTGLYYYGYRYYQPWAGRWLSADLAGTVDGLNLYHMTRNNPINYYDDQGTISLPIDAFNSMNISSEGAHGNRKNEIHRLYGKKGIPMVAQTRAGNSNKKPPEPRPVLSSEHTILHTVSAHGLGRGDNIKATGSLKKSISNIEKLGHAYQEYDEAHRKHIGSNNGVFYQKIVHPMTEIEYFTKLTVTNDYLTYADTQRSLLLNNDISSAIQINQMAYFSDSTELAKLVRHNSESQKTNNSFYHSVSVKDTYYYLKNDSEVVSVDVTDTNKIEMILSRLMGVLGRVPSNKELKNVLAEHNVTVPEGMFSLLNDPDFANRNIFNHTVAAYVSKNAKNKARKKNRKNAANS
ncbi:RHS repeat domain-containing protein [Xenorhabdus szentirmaii]|uniref:RHS repeat domain-containing protein n=1 Tax=Xenorhabdus szentirmaii TaxID=290112 RepID=UPI000C038D7E|nr:RHS repeat domain-containing protein [Xenorhabdus szentirmaii]PHM44332.1 insecticidal toxin, SepC/Tcc class [Xenorhabdus szentirmaii]